VKTWETGGKQPDAWIGPQF